MEFKAPTSMLVAEDGGVAKLVGFPNRRPHRTVRTKVLWATFTRNRHECMTARIEFRATREEMLEDALVLLQEILRENSDLLVVSADVGSPHQAIGKSYELRRKFCVRRGLDQFRYTGGGRRVVTIRNPQKAFVSWYSEGR